MFGDGASLSVFQLQGAGWREGREGGGTAELYLVVECPWGMFGAVLASAEGAGTVERLHTRERVWDHGDGVGGS